MVVVDDAVAVLVDAVAQFRRAGEDRGVERLAVDLVRGEVVVVVGIARVSHGVQVVVFLVFVGDERAIVSVVDDAVPVFVVVYAVSNTVLVDIVEILVYLAVAVIVLAVAAFLLGDRAVAISLAAQAEGQSLA